MDTIKTKIVGVTKGNRQDIIANFVRPRDKLNLVRELDNPFDDNAIAVYARTGDLVGYLSAEIAFDIKPFLDIGRTVRCVVLQITGGKENIFLGVDVELTIDVTAPEKPIAKFFTRK